MQKKGGVPDPLGPGVVGEGGWIACKGGLTSDDAELAFCVHFPEISCVPIFTFTAVAC